MSAWFYLLCAGFFEILFATALKLSEGFTKWFWNACFLGCALVSFALLSRCLEKIPIGTAYAIWTGIGAAGTVVVGMIFFGEPVSALRIVLLLVLVASIVGLKLV